MNNRLKCLARRLQAEDLPAIFVTDAANRRYLTGFTGSAGMLLVDTEGAWLLTDSRYTQQAEAEAPDCCIVPSSEDPYETLTDTLKERGISRVGFEAHQVTFDAHRRMSEKVACVEWIPTTQMVEQLRLIKDEEELVVMGRAADIADRALEEILPAVAPGRAEEDVALDLEFCMRRMGAEGLSFPLIVASGARSSLPHGRASEKIVEKGDFITFDYGARYRGYCSDATRTVAVGSADEEQRRVYDTVLRAQEAAVAHVRPGRTGREVDSVARDIIEEAGYGQYFGHGLGHGVGLAVHEGPSLSQRRGNVELEPGMVVTVEPGIYIPGWGGVRIEDLVVVTDSGCDILTSVGKELVVLNS